MVSAQEKPAKPVRFMLHGNMSHELPSEEFLRFVERVQPDILIMGVFDQRLYSLASPVAQTKNKALDSREILAGWKKVADRLHAKGIRLIGQMELFVVSDRPAERQEESGWFGFYARHWDEKLLGPPPTKNAAALLAINDFAVLPKDDRLALCGCRINTRALSGCVNNPAWSEVQKRMVTAAVNHGIDGFLTNRNYFEHCACDHCREKFRGWLGRRFTPEELKTRFGINNLARHSFACLTGFYRELDVVPDPLHLEKLRFTKERVREFFDEVYLKHGRSLRQDLFAGQWNHAAYFDELHLDRGHLPTAKRTTLAQALADERWGLSAADWGRGESLLWYCNWGTTQNTIVEKEFAGDTVLYGKWLRAMARGKPYVINKYDFYRPRVMMAEAAALGYATNAIATHWQTEEDRAVTERYFAFLRRHSGLYEATESHAEIALVFPRRALHAGDASPLEYVEAAGRGLVRKHLFFDMVPDDLLTEIDLTRYRAVLITSPEYLDKAVIQALKKYAGGGGTIVWMPVSQKDRDLPGAAVARAKQMPRTDRWPLAAAPLNKARTEPAEFLNGLFKTIGGEDTLSQVKAPWTVEAHAYSQAAAKRWVVHLVNYNHNEKAGGKSTAEREAPIAADPVEVRFKLPQNINVRRVRFLSPDADGETKLSFRRDGDFLVFGTPRFLVYGVCVLSSE